MEQRLVMPEKSKPSRGHNSLSWGQTEIGHVGTADYLVVWRHRVRAVCPGDRSVAICTMQIVLGRCSFLILEYSVILVLYTYV